MQCESNRFDLFSYSLNEPKYFQQKCRTGKREKKDDDSKKNIEDIFKEKKQNHRETQYKSKRALLETQ